jgi:hypothetical protein
LRRAERSAYVVRYGFTPAPVLMVLLFSGGATIAGWTVLAALDNPSRPYDDPERVGTFWLSIGLGGVGVVFCGTVALVWLIFAITGQVGLVVDRDGITIGRAPLDTRTFVVPWRDIEKIVIFDRHMQISHRYFCIRLVPDAARPAGVAQPGSLRAWLWNPANSPADVLCLVRGWRLDESALVSAVDRHTRHRVEVEVYR